MGGTKEQVPNSQPVTSSRLLCRNNDEAAFLATLVSHIISDTNAESHSFRAVSEFVYVGDVAWTLRVRARPGRHANSTLHVHQPRNRSKHLLDAAAADIPQRPQRPGNRSEVSKQKAA